MSSLRREPGEERRIHDKTPRKSKLCRFPACAMIAEPLRMESATRGVLSAISGELCVCFRREVAAKRPHTNAARCSAAGPTRSQRCKRGEHTAKRYHYPAGASPTRRSTTAENSTL